MRADGFAQFLASGRRLKYGHGFSVATGQRVDLMSPFWSQILSQILPPTKRDKKNDVCLKDTRITVGREYLSILT